MRPEPHYQELPPGRGHGKASAVSGASGGGGVSERCAWCAWCASVSSSAPWNARTMWHQERARADTTPVGWRCSRAPVDVPTLHGTTSSPNLPQCLHRPGSRTTARHTWLVQARRTLPAATQTPAQHQPCQTPRFTPHPTGTAPTACSAARPPAVGAAARLAARQAPAPRAPPPQPSPAAAPCAPPRTVRPQATAPATRRRCPTAQQSGRPRAARPTAGARPLARACRSAGAAAPPRGGV
jgi:hypothetical protein